MEVYTYGSASHHPGARYTIADSELLFTKASELRYRVYCEEFNFLPTGDYPIGREIDEHDDDSGHFYAFSPAQELVGYVRLVRSSSGKSFPFQRHCHVDTADLPDPEQAAEISRLMVRNDYRRVRHGDRRATPQPPVAGTLERRRASPVILLNLYKQMYRYSCDHNIRYWYAAMEKPLARRLQQTGFEFKLIGPVTDYYGPVEPYMADLRELESNLGARQPEMLAWLRDRHADSDENDIGVMQGLTAALTAS